MVLSSDPNTHFFVFLSPLKSTLNTSVWCYMFTGMFIPIPKSIHIFLYVYRSKIICKIKKDLIHCIFKAQLRHQVGTLSVWCDFLERPVKAEGRERRLSGIWISTARPYARKQSCAPAYSALVRGRVGLAGTFCICIGGESESGSARRNGKKLVVC